MIIKLVVKAKAIGEALKENTSLTMISLGGNKIGDEGVKQSERH